MYAIVRRELVTGGIKAHASRGLITVNLEISTNSEPQISVALNRP